MILDKTPRFKFSEAIQILKDSGWTEDDGHEISELDDLSTRAEQRLGQLIKEKYGADFYIIDKFPLEVRPFYTMPDPEDSVSSLAAVSTAYPDRLYANSDGQIRTTSSCAVKRSCPVVSAYTLHRYWKSA